MKYGLFGKSGLRVSEICLGTMTFGEDWGWGGSKNESLKMFNTFVDAGGNFLDTANNYTQGTSEKYLGEFIEGDRDRFVLATKYTSNTRRNDPNAGGNHRKNLMQAVDASLERLKTDYIDLLWVHAWDRMTPVEEMMRALDDTVRSGKVLYLGISDAPAWVASQANTMATMRGWTPFVGLQIEYSLWERTPERELLPMSHYFDIGITAWSPLAMGILTGKYNSTQGTKKESGRLDIIRSTLGDLVDARLNEKNLSIAQEVIEISKEVGCTPSQVALNWVRQQQKAGEGIIIPIIGGKNSNQIKQNIDCLQFELGETQLKRLDEISRIEVGFPHDFLASDSIIDIIYGGTYSSIVDHRR